MDPHYSFARLRVGTLYNTTGYKRLKATYFLLCGKVFLFLLGYDGISPMKPINFFLSNAC